MVVNFRDGGQEPLLFRVKVVEELPGAFAAMTKKKVEAAVIGEDPLLNTNAGAIAALAAANRLPACGFTNFAVSSSR